MSQQRSSQKVENRPMPVRPEAIEFARSGRVENRVTSFEQREQRLWQGVLLLMLLSVILVVAMIFALS